jgi:GAF domain-containing protein
MLLAPMLLRLSAARNLKELLDIAVHDFVALHGAEMGDLQLMAGNGELVIVSARGVDRSFLKVFERISARSGSVCGRAARDSAPTYIADVGADPEFIAYRGFAASVPFRSVLSYPLIGKKGGLLGILSGLSSHPFSPTALELEAAKSYCGQLASAIEQALPDRQLAAWAESTAAALIEATPNTTAHSLQAAH